MKYFFYFLLLTHNEIKVTTNTRMANTYRHNWTNRDYKILFAVCRGNEGDSNRVSELLKIFPNNRANGLRMMIEKYEHLNGNQEVRGWFINTVSKRMLTAWQEYNS